LNDDEKELLKVGAETAMKPFAELITQLFGGPVEQYGGMWTDGLIVRRKIRQIKLMGKLQQAIDAAGFEPCAIPDNIWAPAVQAALLEDDETLQDAWAALLANAADPRAINRVAPSFAAILKELSPKDAKLIHELYKGRIKDADHATTNGKGTGFPYDYFLAAYNAAELGQFSRLRAITYGDMKAHGETIKADLRNAESAKDVLIRCGLLQNVTAIKPVKINARTSQIPSGTKTEVPAALNIEHETNLKFTQLGLDFVRACQPPSGSDSK
jgi:hypothetical protein